MITFLKQAMCDHRGKPSAGRIVHVIGGLCLAVSTLALAGAALLGHTDTGNALLAVTGPLAAMAGFGFVGGKKTEGAGSADQA